MGRTLTIVVALLCLVFTAVSASADGAQPDTSGRRVALVVGNSNYSIRQLALANPKNDAEDVSAALKALDFDVIAATDLDLTSFDGVVRNFKDKAKGAEIALFFYAGHAVQSDHVNYFIPVDANITQESQLKRLAVNIDDVQDALSGVQGVQVMILDSCRDNPFSSLKIVTRGIGGGEASRGLERIVSSRGDSVVLYATRANDVASDGAPGARNSPFSRVLVEILKRPGEHDLRSMLWDVAARVKSESGGKQSPELTMSLSGDYTFNLVNDRLEWETVRTSLDPKVFRGYAARFPLSPFRKQAEQYAGVLEQQELARRQETDKRNQTDDDARRLKDKADRAAKICWENYQRLDLLKTGSDQGGLEKLQRDNTCPSLQPSIETALNAVVSTKRTETCSRLEGELRDYGQSHNMAGLSAITSEAAPCPGLADRITQALADLQAADLKQKEAEDRQRELDRQQAICDDEAGRLKALENGQSAHRTADIAGLGATARCDAVKSDALAFAEDLRQKEAQAAHDARQRLACAAETKTIRDAVAGGPRAAIEALGGAHECETLDVAGGLAQFDDAAQRRQQAICDTDAGRLKSLTDGQSARRTSDIAALGASSRCDSVRTQALALADDLRRQEAKAAQEARQRIACAAEAKTIDDAVAGGTRTVIEALGRAHACETLDVPGALAQFDAVAGQRRQQAFCDEDAGRLKALVNGQGAHRSADIAALGTAARCDTVRNQALALADDLRRQEAKAAHDAKQRLACAAETKTVTDSLSNGSRTTLETLAQGHDCETLDVPGALAQFDDAAAQRRQQAALCDDDAAHLKAIVDGQGAQRIDEIAALSSSARCPSVRAQAMASLDDLHRQQAKAAREAQQRLACASESKTLHDAVVGGSRGAIEALGHAHTCENLDVPGALAQFDAMAEQRRQQEAKAAHDAQQRVACADETRTLHDAVAAEARATIEALGRSHACETLDLGGAYTQVAALAEQHRQDALKACAAADVGALGARGDETGLTALAAQCPSRGEAVAAALQTLRDKSRLADACQRDGDALQHAVEARRRSAVLDLQTQASCPTLDFRGALASIDAADCTVGLKALGGIGDTDETALQGYAADATLCADVRTAARQKLEQIETAKQDDVVCDEKIAEATSRNAADELKALLGQETCQRRHDVIARAIDSQRKAADQGQVAAAECDKAVAAVGRTADDEGSLHRLAADPTLCPAARSAATARLDVLVAARADADRACDTALDAAATGADVERLVQLDGDPICVRRHAAIAEVLVQAQRSRTREGQLRLADIGCYGDKPNGTFDSATVRAVAWYRKAKGQKGATPASFSADFIRELSAQSQKVCVVEASLTPDDTAPQTPPAPLPPAPDKTPNAAAPPTGHSGTKRPPEPPPKKHRFVQPAPQEPPPQKFRPPPRQYAQPAQPRVPRAAPPPPPPVTTQSEPRPHLFY